ncbi:integrase arm-type DNA-binding domain-containing protein [uncultured Kushneria sp.]|uniref:tyrosine-type recombinase/integrase n=1 Tax=uncultured Kushneria sp. TaxID=905033 RepID=UPI00260A2CBC|nr:integrase arm-type DNA-binding domain-containing protein [uncultured Kushneria sp.]
MSLTVRKIEKTKPGEKPIALSDGLGLELRISPNGSKGWRFRYVRPNGKRNMMSLGNYPEVSLAEAREKRTDARRLVAQGIDPVEQRKQEKREQLYATENTFRVLAGEWHTTMLPRWKSTSKRGPQSWAALETHVFPYVGQRAIDDIKPLEWLDLLKRLEAAGKFEQRRKILTFCREIYRYAIITGRATYNPLAELNSALLRHKKQSFAHISQHELPELVQAVNAYDKSTLIRCGLQLLLLTAVRPGELRNARWEEFNLVGKVWKIPAERMKMDRPHQVPLPSQAVAILHELYALTGRYKLLFPGRNDSTKPISDAAFGMALKRMGFDGRHVPHGTRHVVATGLKEMGYPREWIEMQLSHKLPGIEGVYTHAEHMAAEQRPAMMQAWAAHVFPNK